MRTHLLGVRGDLYELGIPNQVKIEKFEFEYSPLFGVER